MTLRRLFTVNVPVSMVFGVGCVFFPQRLMDLYGADLTAAGIALTRLAGAAFLGWGALAFMARNGSPDLMRGAAVALLIQDTVATVVSVASQVGGDFNWLGWTTPAVYGLLAAGYAYLLLAGDPGDPTTTA